MKLQCDVRIDKLTDGEWLCGKCDICIARSKLNYPFERDLKNSFDLVNELKKEILNSTKFFCKDTKFDKNPDIAVFNIYEVDSIKKYNLVCRVEAKYLEGYAFMKSNCYAPRLLSQ